MGNAASFDLGWDFWVLALLVAVLLPRAVQANSDPPPTGGSLLLVERLSPSGTPATG